MVKKGFKIVQRRCDVCKGTGKCYDCKGTGKVNRKVPDHKHVWIEIDDPIESYDKCKICGEERHTYDCEGCKYGHRYTREILEAYHIL